MASEDTTLIVGLEARVDAFEKAFNKAGSIADTKFSGIEKRAKQSADRMSESMAKAGDGMQKIFGAIGVGFGLRELQEIADAYTNMAASIRATSASAGEAKAVHEELAKAADRARTSVDALGGMYLKAKVALDEHNVSVATQLKMAEAVATEYRRDGASIEDAQEAYQKLVRAMIEGGDQTKVFNSIFMQAPDLLRDMATASGESMEQLKADLADGNATIFKLIPALKAVSSTAQDEMSKVPLTIGDAFNKVKNALNEFIGEAATTSGTTRLLTDGLDAVASNMDKVAPAALLVGGLLAGKVAAGFLLSNASAITFMGSIGLVVAALEKLQSFMATTKAAGLDWRDDWLAFSASMGNDAAREELRQRMQDKKDAGTLHLEALKGDGATPGMGDLAGKAATDLKAAVDVIDKTLRSLTGDAEKHGAAGPSSTGHASPAGAGGKGEPSGLNGDDTKMTDTTGDLAAWKKDQEAMQERINLMKAETAERQNFVGSFEQEDAALERTKVAQELLNEAQKAHIAITSEVEANIAKLADAYSQASTQAAALAKTEAEAKQNAKELSDASGGAIKGFVSDLAHGKSAAEALRDALSKLAEKMFNMGFDGLWKQATNNGQAFEGLGKMLTPAETPASLSPMAAGDVKKLADATGLKTVETPHVTVNAANADISGAGAAGASTSSDADKLAAAGNIDTSGTLTDKTPIGSLEAGAGGLVGHDRNLGAGFGGSGSAANVGSANPFSSLPAYFAKTAGQYQDAAFTYLRQKGYSPKEAETLMGNLQQESQFNPKSFNPNDAGPGLNGGGIYQANRARLDDLNKSMSDQFGTKVDLGHKQYGGLTDAQLFEGQMTALHKDVQGQFASSPRGTLAELHRDAPSLNAGKFGHTYEGYGDTSDDTRTGYARGFDRQFTNAPPPPALPAPQLADATQDITKLGASATSATGDLSSFGGSLGGLAKSLTSGLGGVGGGGGEGLGGIFASLAGGFASGGLISGDGTPTSDSNLAMVSDGEFIVNAKAATRNKALLQAINSGKAPKFTGSSQAAFLSHNAYSPTVNVHVEGGAADRQTAMKVATHVNDAVNKSARGFRFSGPQQHARAAASLHKASSKNA